MTTYPTADEMLDLDGPPIEKIDGSETWRGVVGHQSDYPVSSYGRIWSCHLGRLLRPIGGRRIVLKGRATSVGELVLEAWGQPKPAFGAIAWAENRTITEWPYRLGNLRWVLDRADLMAELAVLHRERANRAGEARAPEQAA
jgi:hypothetical protein